MRDHVHSKYDCELMIEALRIAAGQWRKRAMARTAERAEDLANTIESGFDTVTRDVPEEEGE